MILQQAMIRRFSTRDNLLRDMIKFFPIPEIVPMPQTIRHEFFILFEGVMLTIKQILAVEFHESENT